MRTFLINLDKNKDRLAVADASLRRQGVDYERIRAVYGKMLPAWEKNKLVSYFGWWCGLGRRVLDGEIGCAASHLKIYKKIKNEKLSCACILEDDVVVEDGLADHLSRLEKWMDPRRPQIIFLSYHVDYKMPPQVKNFKVVACKRETCSEAYVITRAAAEALFEVNRPIRLPADGWTRWRRMKIIELYHAFPTLAGQSSTVNSEIKESVLSRTRRMDVPYVLGRLIGRPIDFMIAQALRLRVEGRGCYGKGECES